MPGILDALADLDLGQLNAHLEVANGTVSVSGSLDLTTLDPRDLLGGFGDVLKNLDLPAGAGDVAGLLKNGLGELQGLLELPDLGFVGDIVSQLDNVITVLTRLVESLGDGEGIINQVLGDLGGLENLIGDLTSRFTDAFPFEIPEDLKLPIQAIEQLAKGVPATPAALAGLLSQFLAGLDLAALAAPAKEIEGLVAQVRSAGGDFAPIDAEIGRLTAQVRAVTVQLSGDTPDVSVAVAALQGVRGGLDLLIGSTLPGAFARFSQDLTGLQTPDVARRLGAALEPLLARVPALGEDLAETLLAPMRDLVLRVEELTPELVHSLFEELRGNLQGAVAESDLLAAPEVVDDLLDALFGLLDNIPLRRLRDELLGLLHDLEGRIRGLAGFMPAFGLGEQLGSLTEAIQGIDVSAIQDKVQQLVDAVNSAADAFPIEEIRDELDTLIDAVREAIDSFQPALEALSEQLDQLAGQVGSIDFEAAGQASIDLMAGIREKVAEAVGSGDIPEPLRAAIGLAAQGLKEIDLSAQVSAPAEEVIVKIDPALILAPLEPAFAELRRVLEMVTPQSLVEQLDGPYNQLVGALSQLKPDLLLGSISEEFDRAMDLVGNLNPTTLVAPLEAEFQRLKGTVRSAIDPAPLFAPLREAYAAVQGLLDRVDFQKLFAALLSKVSGLSGVVGRSVQQTAAARASGSGGAAAPAVPALPALDVPFKFGDIVRPIVLLVAQVRQVVTGIAADKIAGALELLAAPVAMLGRLADPDHGPLAEVAQAIEERRAQLDLLLGSGPAAELREALNELAAAAGGLQASGSITGQASLDLEAGVASVQIEGRADVVSSGASGVPGLDLDAQIAEALAGLAPPDVQLALRRLSETLDRILPAPLLDPQAAGASAATAAERLASVFDAIDLSPIADELDDVGERMQAKFQSLAQDLIKELFAFWNSIFTLLTPIVPLSLFDRLNAGLDRVKGLLSALDPAPIEAEVGELLDAVLSVLDAYSPAAIAAELGTVFEAALAKLNALNPAALLGDLDPLAGVIADLETLRPSVVLHPLVESTADLQAALERLTNLDLGALLIQAAADLRTQLEVVVQNLRQELDGLLDDLSGGGGDVSVSVSVG